MQQRQALEHGTKPCSYTVVHNELYTTGKMQSSAQSSGLKVNIHQYAVC